MTKERLYSKEINRGRKSDHKRDDKTAEKHRERERKSRKQSAASPISQAGAGEVLKQQLLGEPCKHGGHRLADLATG